MLESVSAHAREGVHVTYPSAGRFANPEYREASQNQRAYQIAKEMCRQASIVAKATELRLEVEVRRTYTTLQCEQLRGESGAERNLIYGLEEFNEAIAPSSKAESPSWFRYAQNILLRNEIAVNLGYSNIGNLRSLTEALRSAERALNTLKESEAQMLSYSHL